MTTYNQVLSILHDIATGHAQLQEFCQSDEAGAKNTAARRFPLLRVSPLKSVFSKRELEIGFGLLLQDLLPAGKENLQEVYSDMLQVLADIIAELQSPAYNDLFTIDQKVKAVPFAEDSLAGWKAELIFKLPYSANPDLVPGKQR